MQISILGIDIGKNSCSVVGVDDRGAVVVRRTMRRQTLIELVEKLPACVIAMEACCGAHHLGRLFAARGHEIRLMSPEYVRPYSSLPPRVAALRLSSRETDDGLRPIRRAISLTPMRWAQRSPISSRSVNNKYLPEMGLDMNSGMPPR